MAGDGGVTYASARGRWVLAAAVLGSGVVALDATVVGVALPSIGREFAVGVASLQWVVSGYTLTLAGFLLLGGALGDRYGRRRVFLVGIGWFAAASLLCAVAPDARTLIVARGLQGLGGALLTPGSLAILQATFTPQDRARAIGAWSGLGGVATAVGPLLGGYLVGAATWRLVFLLNLPVAAAVVLIALRHVPESRDVAARGRLDVAGSLLAAYGLGGVAYGLIEGPVLGWTSASVLAALASGAGALAGFGLVEARVHDPLMPPELFGSTQFAGANAVTFVVYGALGGALFLLPIALQQVMGLSPLAAGAALLPVTLLMLALSARSGALAARIGPRLQMSVGPLVVAAGLALLVRVAPGAGYLGAVLPAVVVFGLGLATTVAPLTATVLAAAPEQRAGIASAINNDVARAAGLLAVAVLPVAAGITGTSYLEPERFAAGFRVAMLLAAGVCALGGVLAAATIRNVPRVVTGPEPPHEAHCALDSPPLRAGD